MDIGRFKEKFDRQLHLLLQKKLEVYQNLQDKDIKENLNYLEKIFSEGKRIRPYLAYISYKSVGGKKDRQALNLFVFLELFHVFALVHDDIMDNADRRHGIKTINKYITDKYTKNKYVDPKHFGYSIAILFGDFLFTWANEILLTNKDFDEKTINRVYEIYKQMINDIFLGQMIDLTITTKDKVTDDEIKQKYLYKTAKYSFIGPLKIGAALEKENIDEKFYESFGKYLGLAFQIQDDLLDIMYDETQTKKSSFNDISQHQHTIFTNYVFKNGSTKQKEFLNKVFGKKLTDSDRIRLRKLFKDSGAIEYGENIINENLSNAINLFEKQNFNKKYKEIFFNLVNLLKKRSN